MIRVLLSAAVTVGLFGLASTASADRYDDDKKPKVIVKKIDADRHCKEDKKKFGFKEVKLKKGKYEVEFDSYAYSPYYHRYKKLDFVIVEYLDYDDYKYSIEKERIKDKKKGDKKHIEISKDQKVKVYFKDYECYDNKYFGVIKFKYKDDYKEEEPDGYLPKPPKPPVEDDDDYKPADS